MKIVESKDVLERRTLTGSRRFAAFLGSGFAQFFGQIVSKRVKTLTNRNLVASRHITNEKAFLPVNVRRSKTSQLLMLPNASTILSPIVGPQGFQIRLPFFISRSV